MSFLALALGAELLEISINQSVKKRAYPAASIVCLCGERAKFIDWLLKRFVSLLGEDYGTECAGAKPEVSRE